MDLSVFKGIFFATDMPWLPDVVLANWAMHGAWAMLICAAVLLVTGRLKGYVRWPLGVLAATWTLLPGLVSPAYWLGLAFQAPSLMSVALCLIWMVQQTRLPSRWATSEALKADARGAGWPTAWQVLGGFGVVLGWVLLLDMLAWWPLSLYAWGFSPAALALACALAALLWLVGGISAGANATASGRRAGILVAVVVLVFTLTRLPSGNVWDAVLDPWLWMALQVTVIVRLVRWLRITFTSASPATPA